MIGKSTFMPDRDSPLLLQTKSVPLWRPRRVLVTRSARTFAHGRAIVERAAQSGAEIVELSNDRISGLIDPTNPRGEYRKAKSTLAVVVAPASKRKLQPIAPSADWRLDLAEGCPAHCAYCYLAGSLTGPPITRVYANLDEILEGLPAYLDRGQVTSASVGRRKEGTTFEASCYTDPLGIEHLIGSLAETVRFFGAWSASSQLRFTTKFADVDPLIGLPHNGRVRVRFSVNAPSLLRFEGGTSSLAARIEALGRLAHDGYKIGLTIAPIQMFDGWFEDYSALLARVSKALNNVADLDLTVELITHRFTPKSKTVLQSWYPGSDLDLDEAKRTRKLTKFGTVKLVYPGAVMKTLKVGLTALLKEHLPQARILYWT